MSMMTTSRDATRLRTIEPDVQTVLADSSDAFERPDSPTIRDLRLVVFKYRALIILTALSTILGTWTWLWLGAESYETSAKVMIRFAREAADPRTTLAANSTRVVSGGRPDIYTESELIKSFALIDNLVTQLHLDQPAVDIRPVALLPRIRFHLRHAYRWVRDAVDDIQIAVGLKARMSQKEKVILALVKGLKTETVKDSTIVNVTLASEIKQGAALILNTLLGQYRRNRLSFENQPSEAAFFQTQAGEASAKLTTSEQQLSELKRIHDISSLPDQLNLAMKGLSEADKELHDTDETIAADEAAVRLLKDRLARDAPNRVVSETTTRNSQLNVLNEKLSDLELEKQQALAKYTSGSMPARQAQEAIERLKQMIAELEPTVRESATTALNATYMEAEKDYLVATNSLEASRAKQAAQARTADAYRQQLRSLQSVEMTYNHLAREVALNGETYRLNAQHAIEARAADAMNAHGITSVEVVDPAVDPIVPSGIRKTYVMGGALAIGLLLGLGLAYMSDQVDHSIHGSDEVERALGVPVWSALVRERRGTAAFSRRNRAQYVAIASRIEAITATTRPLVTAFLPASPGAGATTVAVNVARVLTSEFGQKVVLVEFREQPDGASATSDSDSRLARLSAGIGEEHMALVALDSDLRVLTVTPVPLQLTQKQIAECIQRLPGQFADHDCILLDVSFRRPLYQRAGLAQGAAAVVIVVEARKTLRETVRRLQQELLCGRMRILGAVLNQRRFKIPKRLYDAN
jgi:uncharacterized protein involved in exopolysaccharide biosynthesis/Mrp family chromosome partitioning ATPase